MTLDPPHKLNCYVDESEDRLSQVFVVAVIVLTSDPQLLLPVCERFEADSGKGKVKWRKSAWAARIRYLRMICADDRFADSLCYSVFQGPRDFHTVTLRAVERAIATRKRADKYRVWVYIDALSKEKRHEYMTALRRAGIPTYQVRGVAKDENNALIRLADALAGLVNDALTQKYPQAVETLRVMKKAGVAIEVWE
jgi:hypothetical protein